MSATDADGTWDLPPDHEARLADFLQSGWQDSSTDATLRILVADTTEDDAAVLASSVDATGGRAIHLRYYRRVLRRWESLGGLSSPYPEDIEAFYEAGRHSGHPARMVRDLGFTASSEDDSGEVRHIFVAQCRRLTADSAALVTGTTERALSIGIQGLVIAVSRASRGDAGSLRVVIRDNATVIAELRP